MRVLTPKLVFLLAACAVLPALGASACSGSEFTAADPDSTAGSDAAGRDGQGGSGNGAGGVGIGASTALACDGPEACDDGDGCTVDRCRADGTCDAAPKCLGTEKCCGGECAQCCSHADCDDGVACTADSCFVGQCMHVPDDSECDAAQYCSAEGCRARQVCGLIPNEDATAACDDENPCTDDRCEGSFCRHDFCDQSQHQLCCEGGCAAQCCSDSQCEKDLDPCTVGSCEDGTCREVPLCGPGQECCKSADGTATCGSCCSAADCDDKVGCTEDQCGGGHCSNTPRSDRCSDGYVCDLQEGCRKAPCQSAADCTPGTCQTSPTCNNGTCSFQGCSNGTKCCENLGCAVCCDDQECDDSVACTIDACGPAGCSHTPDNAKCASGQYCDVKLGCIQCKSHGECADAFACTTDTCQAQTNTCTHTSTCSPGSFCTANGCSVCLTDSDCQGAVVTNAEGPGSCNVSKCVKGQCKTTSVECGEQVCCPPFGCQPRCGVIDMTQ